MLRRCWCTDLKNFGSVKRETHQRTNQPEKERTFFIKGFLIAPWQQFSYCNSYSYYLLVVSRVNGMLRNTAAFAEAFQCPVGSSMNPSRKCTIW